MTGGHLTHPVVVLDRDGTVVFDREYLADPAGLEFLPGAAAGLRRMHAMGYRLVVITNQSGVGRGLFSLDRLHAMNDRLATMVRAAGAELAGIYYCPHAPEAGCDCRKPGTALLLRAAAELGFEASRAIVIGDKSSDIEFGQAVGATTILVAPDMRESGANFVVHDLLQAARLIEELRSASA